MKNKRSTVLGLILIALSLMTAVKNELDDDPNTHADWEATFIGITAGANGILQRDQSQHEKDKANGST